jgi:mevalonate pyrophosphate decarboxylase
MAALSGSGSGSNCIFTEHREWAESQRGRDYFNEVTERQATGTRLTYNRDCVIFYA